MPPRDPPESNALLGIWQNQDYWAGEGDDMIYIDDETQPIIIGTGSEDYLCGAWNFGRMAGATPFAHLYNGAPYILGQERVGGRYACYRWHADISRHAGIGR